MLAPPLLIIAAASFTHAWKSTFLGHYVPGLSAVQLATVQSCPGVEIVNGSPTCAQIADSQNITLNAFQNLNPSISCLIPVAEGSYVCVLAQDDAGATISFSTSAAGTSRATGTAKVTATVVATSPATSVAPSSGATSTSISPPATSATLTTSSSAEPEPKTTEPPAPKTTQPPAPKTTEQPPPRPKTTEQPPPPPPKTTEQPPPPPPKTTEQPPPPPPKTTQAPSPPPSSGGADPDIGGCIALHNSARAAAGVGPLTWSDDIANNHALGSAISCANSGCWNCHTDSGPGTIFAQNMYLSMKSCDEAFPGWMASPGHHDNIMSGSWTKFGCASVSGPNGGCSVCDFTW